MVVTQRKIAVVGQGVMGLTCALKLLEDGHDVTVYSHEGFSETTSMSAGAYWWPHKAYPAARVAKWSRETFEAYAALSEDRDSGVYFQTHRRFCLEPDDSAYARHLVDEWKEIDGATYGVPCREAYEVLLPVIDVPTFMPYLKARVDALGGVFRVEGLDGPDGLFPEFALVINCSGVGALHFVNDPGVFPIRGQVVSVSPIEGLDYSMRVYQKREDFTLILPRKKDIILGGTTQEGRWDREASQEDTDTIVARCTRFFPELGDCEILRTAVGLRPGRKQVRLELELIGKNQPVIHNYGHGGGGYTVALGCANEVLALANEYFSAK